MTLTLKKTIALSAALFAVPIMLISTTAFAGKSEKHGRWQSSVNFDRHNDNRSDRYGDRDTEFEVLEVGHRGRRNRNRRICKRSVVGIGYGTSKSLARANAVQAWSREARSRYGRTYRLNQADVVSAIRCQYNGNDRRGRFSKRGKSFRMPGEAGNPNHNWNCTVNAKPCKTRSTSNNGSQNGSRWKRRFCKDYSRKAMRQQRRNIRLGCEYQGRKWHRNYRRHISQCMRAPMFRSMKTMWRHSRKLRQCR